MSDTWKQGWMGLLVVGLLTVTTWQTGFAADNSRTTAGRGRGGGFGFLARLDHSVALTPEQKDAVHGLLAEQRQASQTLREQTDGKIRALLTPDQQKKFDAFLAQLKNSRGGFSAQPS